MIPWVRFCSNGYGFEKLNKPGFVLFGGKNFYSGYGFKREGSGESESVIGYMPNGEPHTIDNDVRNSQYPIHVPPPEIEKITVIIQKELYRRATIDWVCFSSKQLEYMTPYFLVPGITCLLEWGWNHFDTTSLLDLDDTKLLTQIYNNPYSLYTDHILKSKGNYDVLFGRVTHFEWSIDGLRINCKTEITSKDRLYAGLPVETNVVDLSDDNKKESPAIILDSLKNFVKDTLPNIRTVATYKEDITKIPGVGDFVSYLKNKYPEDKYGKKADNLIYGIFYGRDMEEVANLTTVNKISAATVAAASRGQIQYSSLVSKEEGKKTSKEKEEWKKINYINKTDDFDYKDSSHLWINMGLLVEILNYHYYKLEGINNVPMFNIDIDDCIISGHPNLISTDGNIILIPNSNAPKYFFGLYGYEGTAITEEVGGVTTTNQIAAATAAASSKGSVQYASLLPNSDNIKYSDEEYKILAVADQKINFQSFGNLAADYAKETGQLPDYRLFKVCSQNAAGMGEYAYRDDLNVVINQIRFSKGLNDNYEFPFKSNYEIKINNKSYIYPAKYTGFLKNIYFNVKEFQRILADSSVKYFGDVLNKVLTDISKCSANFWDFRLVESTGKQGLDDKEAATMKIIDYRFIYSVNKDEKVYTFDYYDSEGLLQNIKFTPTLSNAQAIRTIYAETNNPNKTIVMRDTNELLDYHFQDRLFRDAVNKSKQKKINSQSSFKQLMKSLQGLTPATTDGSNQSFQMTMKKDGNTPIIKRLVLPSNEVLQLLLDDGDIEDNPKYTGIMPGIQASFTIQGIGGLRTFMMFLVRNLPEPYSHKNVVFRIIDLNESIEAGKWTTTITAGIIPLRDNIKRRLNITNE